MENPLDEPLSDEAKKGLKRSLDAAAAGEGGPVPDGLIDDIEFLKLTEGTILDIGGVRCKIVYINDGKRRLSITPVDLKQRMPMSKFNTNPIVGGKRTKKKSEV